ncbi:MAG TPA: ATP-binding protein [Terriglobales bacterium]|nr:ATP-binding protein [Terriglobales bacterium]
MDKLLGNPEFLKIAFTFAVGTFAFCVIVVIGYVLYRRLKQEITPEVSGTRVAENNSAFSLAAYEGVIRKLKDQEKELERLRKSERDRAFESASTSEAVLSNLASGVLLFNTALLVRQANPAARSLLGYASPTGMHARDVFRGTLSVQFPNKTASDGEIADGGTATLVQAVESAVKQGTTIRRLEADYKTPDGTQRVLGITISPVKGPGGETQGAACLISDLTEITQLSRQVRMRESMAALGEMSAGIAHEFKNSLATISGYAQMLASETGQGSPHDTNQQFAEKINAETASLSRIVNDFLNFARPQGFVQEPVDISAMIEDCAAEAQVALEISGANQPIVVKGDPTALRQAFSNLFRNSAEAVSNGVRPKVKVEVTEAGGRHQLTLTDNGAGIPADALPNIFIPFFTTKASGTGLGLALVHRIVTEQGGTIQAQSSPSGATFTLTFPRQKDAKNPAISG